MAEYENEKNWYIQDEMATEMRQVYYYKRVQNFMQRHEYAIPDGFHHLMESLGRISQPTYEPRLQDRVSCTDPITTHSTLLSMYMYDSEVRVILPADKTDDLSDYSTLDLTVFNNIDIPVIFFTFALSDFDEFTLDEKNRMVLAIEYFARVKETFGGKARLVVLFTKVDLFREKIRRKSFRDYFGGFEGEENEKAIREFIKGELGSGVSIFVEYVLSFPFIHSHSFFSLTPS